MPSSSDFEEVWKEYKELFSAAQHGKCAYCESHFRAAYPGDVEHFRPKAGLDIARLDGEKLVVVSRTDGGYYWLAYEFENYLFSCFRCNNHKRNHFPRAHNPRLAEGCEKRETCWLLNPFNDDPAPHVGFDEVGVARAHSQKGTWSIAVFGLNRDDLLEARGRTATSILRDLDDFEDALALSNSLAERQAFRRLHDACRPEAQYAAMARLIVQKRIGLTFEELDEAHRGGVL